MTIPHQNSNSMLHGNRKPKVHMDAQRTPKKKSALEQKSQPINQATNKQIKPLLEVL